MDSESLLVEIEK